MPDFQSYRDADFTAGDSPAIIDLSADFGSRQMQLQFFVDQDRPPVSISFSIDGGTVYTDPVEFGPRDALASTLAGLTHVKIEHIEDTGYVLIVFAVAGNLMFNRGDTLGTSSSDPVFVTAELSADALKQKVSVSGQVQVASGVGVLRLIINTKQQTVDLWDFDGAGPTDPDLIGEFQPMAAGIELFNIRFVNGLRIDSQGMDLIVHYSLDS